MGLGPWIERGADPTVEGYTRCALDAHEDIAGRQRFDANRSVHRNAVPHIGARKATRRVRCNAYRSCAAMPTLPVAGQRAPAPGHQTLSRIQTCPNASIT